MSEREVDAFDDIAQDAMAASQSEMFDEAVGATAPEQDRNGDQSLETMGDGPEGRGEEGDEPEGGEEQPEPERDERGQFARPQGDRHEAGLRGELRGERDKRQAAEQALADYRKATDDRLAELQRQIAQGQQRPTEPPAPQAQPQQRQPADAEPDMYLDPDGWKAWNGREMDRRVAAAVDRMEAQRVGRSFEATAAQHGEKFAAAYQAANALDAAHPDTQALLTRIKTATDPGAALMSWHGRQLALKEIGDDPVAYRARVEAEVRASLAQQGQGAAPTAGQGRPGAPDIRLPPSLNGAQGGSGRTALGATSLNDHRGLFSDATRGM